MLEIRRYLALNLRRSSRLNAWFSNCFNKVSAKIM